MSQLPPNIPNYQHPSQAVYQAPPTSGLAVAALVCGCIGVLFFPLAIVAIVLGIIALVKTRDPRVGGRGLAIGGIAAGAAGLLVGLLLMSILLPSLNRAREAANRIQCASHMRQIGLALRVYSNENQSLYPRDLATLAAASDIEPSVFICPLDDLDAASGADWATKIVPGGPHCSYIYIYRPGMSDRNLNADAVVLYEPLSNHGGDGGNVLYADGHVDWLSKAAFQQEITRAGGNPAAE
ncbi:MAG TPA: DUF4190 domain-containing protein [Tepidisphaeraceae bacterium]|jgi:prepilin-type processing-associated H-X9-DG protein